MIDSHVHVVSADEEAYPRASDSPAGAHAAAAIGAEEMLEIVDDAGIDQVVLVQSFAAYAFDNRYVLDMASSYPDRFVAVCGIDPKASDVEGVAEGLVRAGACGLRVLAFTEDFEAECLRPLMQVAADSGVAVCLLAVPRILEGLGDVLRDYPDVPLVLDHCGLKGLDAGAEDLGAPEFFGLAQFEAVYPKLSTRVFAHATGPVERIVDVLVDRFGASRLMWGSDFPASPVESYGAAVREARELIARLDAAGLEEILNGTANRVFRLGSAN
ncbi:MAG: amidohydrolase family protein [bacterium]|nr:amidohydrolase family protein [bacterium]